MCVRRGGEGGGRERGSVRGRGEELKVRRGRAKKTFRPNSVIFFFSITAAGIVLISDLLLEE